MKFGIVMPPDDIQGVVNFAVTAEQAGWDGFFISEGMWSVDVWVCLTAAAMRTKTIRLGTLLSPLSCMRPWKLATQAATLDHLSNGRVIISIGMGAIDTGFAEFGEVLELKTRAELVDEGLHIIKALWRGEPFEYKGKHYRLDLTSHEIKVPVPVQKPRIPIWMVAAWPRPQSMQRVLNCDGIIPIIKPKDGDERPAYPDDILAIKDWIEVRRTETHPFDIVIEGQTPGDDPDEAQAIIHSWQEAGATWWIESIWGDPATRENRLRQGSPSFS
jgi:hypothetical protein